MAKGVASVASLLCGALLLIMGFSCAPLPGNLLSGLALLDLPLWEVLIPAGVISCLSTAILLKSSHRSSGPTS